VEHTTCVFWPFNEHNIFTFDDSLSFNHIKRYVFVPSWYPKNTQGMDLDSNLVLFSLGTCAKALQPKILKWDISGFLPLHVSWGVLESKALVGHWFLMYIAVFIASPQNSSFNAYVKIILLAHFSMYYWQFYNTILLWGIGCIVCRWIPHFAINASNFFNTNFPLLTHPQVLW
jgi:hypothetical protein